MRLVCWTLTGLMALPAAAGTITFADPTGDDFGPGSYVYPTDTSYPPGAFDLTGFSLSSDGGVANVGVSVKASLAADDAGSAGFARQMVFVFIDNVPGGHTEGLPGLNLKFAADSAWDKVILLSPQSPVRLAKEIQAKAAEFAADIILPKPVIGGGGRISASFDAAQLGGATPMERWGYQVVMQSNESFPMGGDLLTRRVDEEAKRHRFGGGNDGDCDPGAIDILAGRGTGEAGEIAAQRAQLGYECELDGSVKSLATLRMIRK